MQAECRIKNNKNCDVEVCAATDSYDGVGDGNEAASFNLNSTQLFEYPYRMDSEPAMA